MSCNIARFFHFSLEIEFNALRFINYTIPRLCSTYAVATLVTSVVSIHFFKATFHFTISRRGQRATGKIQRNNYHHGSCEPSLTGKTSSVTLIFTHGTHRNVKNVWKLVGFHLAGRRLMSYQFKKREQTAEEKL